MKPLEAYGLNMWFPVVPLRQGCPAAKLKQTVSLGCSGGQHPAETGTQVVTNTRTQNANTHCIIYKKMHLKTSCSKCS